MKNLKTFKTKDEFTTFYEGNEVKSNEIIIIEEDNIALTYSNNGNGEFKQYGIVESGGKVEELPYEIVQPTDETHCDKLIASSGWKFIGNKDDIADRTLLVLKFKDGFDYNDYFVNVSCNDNKKGSIQYILRGNPTIPDNSIDYQSSSSPKPAFPLSEYGIIGDGIGVQVIAPIDDTMQGLDFNYCIIKFQGTVVSNKTNFKMIKY